MCTYVRSVCKNLHSLRENRVHDQRPGYLPWLLSWLDRGAPGCGTLVVRGPTGHK